MIKTNAKVKKSKKIVEQINDDIYTIEDFYREEKKELRPPVNTLSELVFKNKIKEIEKILSDTTLSIDERDMEGETHSWTPLYWAVKFRHIECVKVLLKHGATVNTVITDMDECCGTVLDLATLRGDAEIEEVLREHVDKEAINTTNSPFSPIRTKLRGKAPAFNFTFYGKAKQ